MDLGDYGAPQAAEVRDQLRNRDAAAVGQHEVRFTNVADFLADLDADYKKGSIEDNIVRVSVIGSDASLDQIYGRPVPGGNRRGNGWQAKYVSAAYLARGQLVKLSAYCGVAPQVAPEEAKHLPDVYRQRQRVTMDATAAKVQETVRAVLAPLDRKSDLEVRGGGVYVESGEWIADPDFSIDAPPAETCATCHHDIYFANQKWRHKDTKQAEHYIDNPDATAKSGPFGRKLLHHLADPFIEDRKV